MNLPTIIDHRGKEHKVCKWGVITPGAVRRNRHWLGEETFTEVPDKQQIKWCLEWLEQHAVFRKTENSKLGSYTLKHRVESDIGLYIENGAFVVAAYKFGATVYTDNSPNPSFNMNYVEARQRLAKLELALA